MGFFSSSSETQGALKISRLKEEGCVVNFEVQVPAAQVQEALHNAMVRLQAAARVPGFRPGKAPLGVIRQRFATSAQERALDQILEETVPKVLDEHKLNPVAPPRVTLKDLAEGQPYVFHLAVEIAPRVQPRNYKRIPVTRRAHPPEEEAVARQIEELREGNSRLESSPEEAVAAAHYVVIDYETRVEGKPLKDHRGADELLDMSAGHHVEGLTQGLLGARRGETREVDVRVNGRAARARATVKEIKAKVLPPLDDELARDVGASSLEDLKVRIRSLLEEEGRRRSDREILEQLQRALLNANRFPVPPTLVHRAVERRLESLRSQLLGHRRDWAPGQREKLAQELGPMAEDEVRLSYLLRAIAEVERLSVTEADLEAQLDKNLNEASSDAERERLRRAFQERRDDFRELLLRDKALRFVRDAAEIKEG